MTSDNRGGPRKGRPDTTSQPPRSITEGGDKVDEILETIRRFESAARVIADEDALTIKARCKALLDLMARARKRDGAAFLETAIWRGCRHFFESDERVPRDVIDANRRLIRQGHDRCPECRRPLPDHSTLDFWRQLGHDSILRRPA
jgi:hypothetical protein